MKKFIAIFLTVVLGIQTSVQAVNLKNAALATGAAICLAGYRSASKDGRPEEELTKWSDVQQAWNKSYNKGLKAFLQYFDDRIIGNDEQPAVITDFDPIVLKDAKTGQEKTVYLGKGTIRYGKAQGIGALNKKFKYANAGLNVTQKVGGLIILGVLAYRHFTGSSANSISPASANPNPSIIDQLRACATPAEGAQQDSAQKLAAALANMLATPKAPSAPASGAALVGAVEATRRAAGGVQLLTNGIASICPSRD